MEGKITIYEASRILGMHPSSLHYVIARGQLTATKGRIVTHNGAVRNNAYLLDKSQVIDLANMRTERRARNAKKANRKLRWRKAKNHIVHMRPTVNVASTSNWEAKDSIILLLATALFLSLIF